MLTYCLSGHVEPNAQLAERLTVLFNKPVQQRAAMGVRQSLKDRIRVHRQEVYATKWLHVKKQQVAPRVGAGKGSQKTKRKSQS
jgi:hypothetical protein